MQTINYSAEYDFTIGLFEFIDNLQVFPEEAIKVPSPTGDALGTKVVYPYTYFLYVVDPVELPFEFYLWSGKFRLIQSVLYLLKEKK